MFSTFVYWKAHETSDDLFRFLDMVCIDFDAMSSNKLIIPCILLGTFKILLNVLNKVCAQVLDHKI
jgi:hypothetical protein